MITEKDLREAQDGNSEAFTRIYNETVKTAYYVAKHILLDEGAVEDVLQEAYISVYKHLGDYKTGNFQGWVDTIVANRAKNYMRKKNPTLFSDLETEEKPVVEFEDENIEFRPDEKTDYDETKRLVMEIVDGLPTEQRLSIILFYFEQKSVKEIADICECSENTIKSRLNYARKKIKEDVLTLEKKGTKLYSVSAIPFLIWLFSEEAKACVVPEAMKNAILKSIDSSVKSAIGQTGKLVGENTVKTMVAKTGMAIGTKIAVAAVAATVVIGGIIAGVSLGKGQEGKNKATQEVEQPVAESSKKSFQLKKSTMYYSDENYQNGVVDVTVTYHYDQEGRCILGEGKEANGEEREYEKYVFEGEKLVKYNDLKTFNYTYEYDDKGVLYKTTKYSGDTVLNIIMHEYDNKGYLIKDTAFNADGTLAYVEEYVNDESGRMIKSSTDRGGNTLDVYETYEYDEQGNLIQFEQSNENGLISREVHTYDSKGNCIKCEHFGVNGLDKKEINEYDDNGNLVSKTVSHGDENEPYLIQRTFYEYEEITSK